MSNSFVMPVSGKYRVSSPFGWRVDPVTKKNTRHHNGTDIVTGRRNEPILAVMNGRVLKAGRSTAANGGFGNYVVLRHFIDGKFYTSLYAHMQDNSIRVRVGQLVKAGDQLGIMGTTGHSTGIHLHLEIWQGMNHGWSADGSGFLEPISFLQSMAKAQEAKEFAARPTPQPAKPNPVPQHIIKPNPGGTIIPPNIAKPVRKDPVAPKVDPKRPKSYIIKSGDTLTKIAREFNTTVPTLKRINNIANANNIRVGQVIRLP